MKNSQSFVLCVLAARGARGETEKAPTVPLISISELHQDWEGDVTEATCARKPELVSGATGAAGGAAGGDGATGAAGGGVCAQTETSMKTAFIIIGISCADETARNYHNWMTEALPSRYFGTGQCRGDVSSLLVVQKGNPSGSSGVARSFWTP